VRLGRRRPHRRVNVDDEFREQQQNVADRQGDDGAPKLSAKWRQLQLGGFLDVLFRSRQRHLQSTNAEMSVSLSIGSLCMAQNREASLLRKKATYSPRALHVNTHCNNRRNVVCLSLCICVYTRSSDPTYLRHCHNTPPCWNCEQKRSEGEEIGKTVRPRLFADRVFRLACIIPRTTVSDSMFQRAQQHATASSKSTKRVYSS